MAKYHTQVVFRKEIIYFNLKCNLQPQKNIQLKFKQVLDASTNYSTWWTYNL